jgi:hypothetical protein
VFTPGELRYESVSAQTDISLQNGAVVMRPRIGEGSTMIAEPRWFYDVNTRTMVINLINITSSSIMAKEGIGTVQMSLGETKYNYTTNLAGSTLKMNYTSDTTHDYSVAWDNYFTKTLPMTEQLPSPYPPARTYILPSIDTLVIKTYEVQIKNI